MRAVYECTKLLSDKIKDYTGVSKKAGQIILVSRCVEQDYVRCYHDKIEEYYWEWRQKTMADHKDLLVS